MKKKIITAITAIFALVIGFTSCAKDEGLDIVDYRFKLETDLADTTQIPIGMARRIVLSLKEMTVDSTNIIVSQESFGSVFLEGAPDKVYNRGEKFGAQLNDSNQIVLYYVPGSTGLHKLKINVTNKIFTQSVEKYINSAEKSYKIYVTGYLERTDNSYWLHSNTDFANHMYFVANFGPELRQPWCAPCDITLTFNFGYNAAKYTTNSRQWLSQKVTLKIEKGKHSGTCDVVTPVPVTEDGSNSLHYYKTDDSFSSGQYNNLNNVKMEVSAAVTTIYYPTSIYISKYTLAEPNHEIVFNRKKTSAGLWPERVW